MPKKTEKASTYSVECECGNCNYIGPAEFARGAPVPSEFECPKCGCKKAKKREQVRDSDRVRRPFSPPLPWEADQYRREWPWRRQRTLCRERTVIIREVPAKKPRPQDVYGDPPGLLNGTGLTAGTRLYFEPGLRTTCGN